MAEGKALRCGLGRTMDVARGLGLRYVGHAARLDGFHVGVFEDSTGYRWQVPCGTDSVESFERLRVRSENFAPAGMGQGGLFVLPTVETEGEESEGE